MKLKAKNNHCLISKSVCVVRSSRPLPSADIDVPVLILPVSARSAQDNVHGCPSFCASLRP